MKMGDVWAPSNVVRPVHTVLDLASPTPILARRRLFAYPGSDNLP